MMFTVEWAEEPFDRMGQIIRLNPARKDELADALRELTARCKRTRRPPVSRAAGDFGC